MKKVIYGTLFLGLIGLGIVGCKKESIDKMDVSSTITEEQRNILINYDYSQIGKLHNEGLDKIIDDLKNSSDKPLSGNKNLESLAKTIYTSTDGFINKIENFRNLPNHVRNEILEKSKLKFIFNQKSSSDNDLTLYLEEEILTNISSEFAIAKIEQINSVFEEFVKDDDKTIEYLLVNLENYDTEINNVSEIISIEDYIILKSLISTAMSSTSYWNDNLDEWQDFLNPDQGKADWDWFKNALKNMAKADAYGAGVGMVVGAVTAAPTGPGIAVGAAAGAVGYGMNSSAVAGVREIFN